MPRHDMYSAVVMPTTRPRDDEERKRERGREGRRRLSSSSVRTKDSNAPLLLEL